MRKSLFAAVTAAALLAGPAALAEGYKAETRWWKGNTHTHSWWSDGDTPPEVVADWYKQRGYNFLVFSDHNVMQEGEKWYPIARDPTRQALAGYREMFGDDWVIERTVDGVEEIRLRALDEFRNLFEEPSKFAFIKGEEISDRYHVHPIHLNGVNLAEKAEPQGGHSVANVIQNNMNAVAEQSRRRKQPMLIHLNHPNFHYAVQPEDLFHLDHGPGDGFFEIYNGHPRVENRGDHLHPSTERMWDIVLAKRLGEFNRSVVYGMAVDDAHEYTAWGLGETNPGRGWIMVRAERLTPNTIAASMKKGDFYSSSGVTLKALTIAEGELSLEVEAQPGVDYVIEFVGTRRNADLRPRTRTVPHLHEGKGEHLHREITTYSDEIGEVLSRVKGGKATYKAAGDEIYVRARVIASAPHPNPSQAGEPQMAWTQPLVVRR
jgi:hypothetical protein